MKIDRTIQEMFTSVIIVSPRKVASLITGLLGHGADFLFLHSCCDVPLEKKCLKMHDAVLQRYINQWIATMNSYVVETTYNEDKVSMEFIRYTRTSLYLASLRLVAICWEIKRIRAHITGIFLICTSYFSF